MDNSLHALCETIKKILSQLKPQTNQLSFIVMTGKNDQGKTSLLKQSTLEEVPVLSEQHAKVYFNQQGIIVELGQSWLSNSKSLLHNTLRKLNKCSRHLKITGLILCVDVANLLIAELGQFNEGKKEHIQLLERMALSLGYQAEIAIIFTKMDTLAGFSEFYQMNHPAELSQPLGFSLGCANQLPEKVKTYKEQFNRLIETQGQQVIHKMHPARSTIKRSLIREFPLQLASLGMPIQSFIQSISPKLFHLHSVYFTSAEQGGVSIDRLNKKIQHEYALVVQDSFPQSTNFRSYFVEGALKSIQEQCSQAPQSIKISEKPLIAIAAGVAGICLLFLSFNYLKTARVLDETSKELLAFDALNSQTHHGAQALYHLSQAADKIEHIGSNSLSLPMVHQLKINLHHNAQHKLFQQFIPALIAELEQVITNPSNTPLVRYKALKVYIMLSQPTHFSAQEVYDWFNQQWHTMPSTQKKNQLALLQDTLNKPLNHIMVKQQVITDARNYLNALPTSYLYYSLAKGYFSAQEQKIAVEGFSLSTSQLPVYFTKAGFKEVMKELPHISQKLQEENWVLAHQDLGQLKDMLGQAYCFDYLTWWQTFMRKSMPLHYQDYQQGRQVTQVLQRTNAIAKLIHLIQQETKPDLAKQKSNFNDLIANKFTNLNLISMSSIKELSLRVTELDRFIGTLAVIKDGGKTAFSLTKIRFTNNFASDPVSLLYNQGKQLPEPLNNWVNQIAGDAWGLLIKDSRQYINRQWQQTVYQEFHQSIDQRYPFNSGQDQEISIADFNRFFSPNGLLNVFAEEYLKPFLDVSSAEWKPKAINDFVLPITPETLDAIIRANIITNMFFPERSDVSKINFSLQKINLDPVIASLHLDIGKTQLMDTQGSDSLTHFSWPQANAKLSIDSIDGNHYEIAEEGHWALFKLLEKVNVLIDEQDGTSLQILFEVNSNSGRYLLKTNNQVNPFTPGILNGFALSESIV